MTPKGSEVPSKAAPSHDQANPDWPWCSLHGWKWSDDIAQSKPASSARLVQRSRSEGANCSCETWYPKRAIFSQSLQMRSVGTSAGHRFALGTADLSRCGPCAACVYLQLLSASRC